MSLTRQFERRCHRLTGFIGLRAASRNSPLWSSYYRRTTFSPSLLSAHVHIQTTSPATNQSKTADAGPRPKIIFTRPGQHLVLGPKDKDRIQSSLDYNKPKRLRTEKEVFAALRENGYTPAVDRIDEMLDMNRSPFQTVDEFDKITLGLLLKSAKTVDGGIRNPYKIPHLPAGVNPVRTRKGLYPKQCGPPRWFLFPDSTNHTHITTFFPLREPPRPWHPTVMMGLKQDYSKEEVARRLEWSKVQNAKKLRNNYGWAPPDPATYPHLQTLPPPPPPVIRACNTCHQPRYLMRFWNFYYQRWQHVSSPHRALDCFSTKNGSCGRLMYAPPGTKIGGIKATKIENKDWIEEETAIKLLFRSGFIPLPTINAELGKIMIQASKCASDYWGWIHANDIQQWALRGGRMNGLVDLTNVRKLEDVDAARKRQQKEFIEKHAKIIDQARELLEREPVSPEIAVTIPDGQLYPIGHAAANLWFRYERSVHQSRKHKDRNLEKQRKLLRQKIKGKLAKYESILEEMKVTKAEIAMLESGQGEVWINPEFAALEKSEQVQLLQRSGEFDPSDPTLREDRPAGAGPFKVYPRRLVSGEEEESMIANASPHSSPLYKTWETKPRRSDTGFRKFDEPDALWERQVALGLASPRSAFKKLDDTSVYTKRYNEMKRRLDVDEDTAESNGAFGRGYNWDSRHSSVDSESHTAAGPREPAVEEEEFQEEESLGDVEFGNRSEPPRNRISWKDRGGWR
ncbi:hypothetical protein TWF696_005690 [Orbilia brochopaga]|uniref:Uncharacterized protein n=1 Tax=Orbilia brochopaga TaxID=3140254 RepID=A0AAV9UUU3_9PEZI